ncbi:hypothetical protein [Actinospica robiniae]|uniref:hypothetical protein n=1 Tax=Actinospica robiniae TaxID=304901 RepID=UPI00040740DD|nr:hypothetical protein [Actinospica robiniae]
MAGKWRAFTVVVLAALAGTLSTGASHADSSAYGLFFPESPYQYDSNTGTHTAQIRITADSPLVGADVPVDFTVNEASGIAWFGGLSASGESGASCGKQSASGTKISWKCVPGSSGWSVGSLAVSVDTATTKTACTLLPSGEMWECTADSVDFGGPDAPAAGSTASDGGTWSAGFAIEIVPGPAPCAAAPPPCSASDTAAAKTTAPHAASSSAPAAGHTSAAAGSTTTNAEAAASTSGSSFVSAPASASAAGSDASASPTDVPVASSAPAVLDAVPTASASGSGSNGIEVALPIVLVVLAVAFFGWRFSTRRRRPGGPDDQGGQGSTDE